jgi:GTP-binding protein Era
VGQPGQSGREIDGPLPQGHARPQTASGSSVPGLLADGLGYGELKRLLPLIREQYEPILSERKTICIAGPVNTGKSSLYNALVTDPSDRARVSPVPGTTRQSQTGDASAFWVIDTPGANEMVVGAEGPQASGERRAEAINSAAVADLLVIVFDAARGVAHDEATIYRELTSLSKPAIVVLNKIDLVRSEQDAVVKAAAHNLQLAPEEIIPTSALKHTNLDRLILAIVNTDPQLLATLAEAIPQSRWLLANNTILSACGAAATANLLTSPVQVPFASFVPISAIQVAMVLRLARVFGFHLSPGRAKEILLALGSGLLGRTLFYQLVDLVPVAGYVLGTAVAAGTTAAIGYSVATWFAYGEQPSAEKVKGLSEALTQALVDGLKQAPDRRAVKRSVKMAVADALAKVVGEPPSRQSSR